MAGEFGLYSVSLVRWQKTWEVMLFQAAEYSWNCQAHSRNLRSQLSWSLTESGSEAGIPEVKIPAFIQMQT